MPTAKGAIRHGQVVVCVFDKSTVYVRFFQYLSRIRIGILLSPLLFDIEFDAGVLGYILWSANRVNICSFEVPFGTQHWRHHLFD